MSGLSAPRLIFGVHAFTPYSRTDGTPYGTIKVLKSSSLTLTGALVDLLGGSSKYPWASEPGPITAELSLKGNAYADFLFTLFLGFAPTTTTNAAGSISALVNKKGTSVFNAVTGVASVAVTSADDANLKFGKYLLVATNASHVDVYMYGDIDIARGTDGTMQNDSLKVTATALAVTTSGVLTHVPNFGMDVVGGSGTIALVTGDTAEFSVMPDNSSQTTVNIGSSSGTLFPEFGAIVHAAKRGDQELNELDVYRCIGSGMPINFDANTWSEYDIKIKCLYDSAQDGVFGYRYVFPTNT